MNCLEFHRQLLTDPGSQDPDLLQHREECPDCRQFVAEMSAFEVNLHQAMNIPIPDDLATSIQLRQSLRRGHEARRPALLKTWAVAAGLLLATGLAALMTWQALHPMRDPMPLAEVVLHHIHDESEHLAENRQLSAEKLNQLISPFGYQVDPEFGDVRYAGTCPIGDTMGVHLVLPSPHGPVTVILLPNKRLAGSMPIHDRRFSGMLMPLNGGTLAVVGSRHAPIQPIIEHIEKDLHQTL